MVLAAPAACLRLAAKPSGFTPGKAGTWAFFLCKFTPFWEICHGSAWAHPDSPPAGDTGGSTVTRTAVCMDIYPPLGTHSNVVASRVITSFAVLVITKMGNYILEGSSTQRALVSEEEEKKMYCAIRPRNFVAYFTGLQTTPPSCTAR